MTLNSLTALSPLDGRYRSKTEALAACFSEFALIRYRIWVEIEYLIALFETGLPPFRPLTPQEITALRSVYQDFTEEHAAHVKSIERVTNHDVKAVEYYIKECLQKPELEALLIYKEFIHFGLTSQDINNTATPLMLREGLRTVYIPQVQKIVARLEAFAASWRGIPMLAHTHGQPASPTTLGKEMAVFAERISRQLRELESLPYPAKFGGATGNLNAHYAAYPAYDWHQFAQHFVGSNLGLSRSWPTTQIEHYDGLAAIFDNIRRINSIITDLCQDMWLYISMGYFRQKTKTGEVGSSAMPHKVNPIDFENAEGNCGLSTALLEFMSRKLPVSRLQRDLTDSTILRNVGAAVGYAFLSAEAALRGLDKLMVNEAALRSDLDANWAVLAEAIQTILRREGYPEPYEALKDLTRGQAEITADSIRAFISGLNVDAAVKTELLALSPETYLGDAGRGL
ncbi:MAG: adenylosuccinate lyase [Bacteroidetes bacterium]|nr:MAG: adenylosuccinate lyase [Bacteroidota bacterium]